jgi:hypothetical protein
MGHQTSRRTIPAHPKNMTNAISDAVNARRMIISLEGHLLFSNLPGPFLDHTRGGVGAGRRSGCNWDSFGPQSPVDSQNGRFRKSSVVAAVQASQKVTIRRFAGISKCPNLLAWRCGRKPAICTFGGQMCGAGHRRLGVGGRPGPDRMTDGGKLGMATTIRIKVTGSKETTSSTADRFQNRRRPSNA